MTYGNGSWNEQAQGYQGVPGGYGAPGPQAAPYGAPMASGYGGSPAPQPQRQAYPNGYAVGPAPQPQAAQAQQPAPQQVVRPAPEAAPRSSQAAPSVTVIQKGHGWLAAVIIALCLAGVSIFGIQSCSTLMGGGMAAPIHDDTVAVVPLDGSIAYDGSLCSPEGFSAVLDQLESNPKVRAVVLRVNSGGGVAAAGEEMCAALQGFSKPVVVSSAAINASAAYEISSQADYIYVAQSTEIGSIGVRMELTNYQRLMDMLGIETTVFTAGESKDAGSGLRPLTQEEAEHYQHMVDQINDGFIRAVAEGRSMSEEDVRALANGMTYTGLDAVENGLADAVGTRDDAMDMAASLAGLQSYYVYEIGSSTATIGDLSDLLGI